ncbi:hypothetical protein SAMN06296036_11152 [Pseudobacteriovorax antillogorgiicola]|uniref:Uncharacterized protein n=1 Tax=Pseudobacteriovorax antillogorgiicola TaxID=1513793 RepID=A0A1Y6C6A4_9BACT|nr:hypothetical protein EDD56_111126 [Pseudobacteriovorax antillogorgiicola]SMF36582.1 hypothetical protein SAMN06296036_11152 [Pseudobacteriovorax antillogorgiicola]
MNNDMALNATDSRACPEKVKFKNLLYFSILIPVVMSVIAPYLKF